MKKKGCLIALVIIFAIIYFLPLAILGGFIYFIVKLYKSGKFDNITFKTNELLKKIYFKISKKDMKRNVFSPKSFTITFTIVLLLILGSFANANQSTVKTIKNDTVVASQVEVHDKDNKDNKYNKNPKDDINTNANTVDSKDKETTTTEDAELHFINTGNSDSILIIQNKKAALIDGGDNDDEQRIVSYLKNHGVSELEYVVATHPHSDHIGGLDAVVNSFPIKNLFVSNGDANTKTYFDFINAMANKGVHPSVPLLNSEFKLGAATFKVLSVANVEDLNNDSIVLEFINGNDKVLLMGDAEKEIESNLNPGDVDLIKVGHHGSHSSSTRDFLNRVTPEYAVITCGKDNKYGHPHKETMDTLKDMNIEVHRSDECGNIIFKSTGNGLTTNCSKASYTPGKTSQEINTNKTKKIITPNNHKTKAHNTNTVPSENHKVIKKPSVLETDINPEPSSDIVYWTPKGKSYHTTKSCPTLSRSKTILSGTQAESGKSDPCDRCH